MLGFDYIALIVELFDLFFPLSDAIGDGFDAIMRLGAILSVVKRLLAIVTFYGDGTTFLLPVHFDQLL